MQRLLPVVMLLLAASIAANAILWRRQHALGDRLAALERGSAPAARSGGASAIEPGEPSPAPAPDAPAVAPPPEERAPTGTAHAPAIAAGTGEDALTPAQRAAVAREVDRLMKERGAGEMRLRRPMSNDDLLALLQRELGLSESQKTRIGEIWKQRDAEMRKLVEAGDLPPPRKLIEMQGQYDGLVKRELDIGQQQKYDDLKKQGKIPAGGLVFALQVDGDEPPK